MKTNDIDEYREYIEKQRLTKTDEQGVKYWACEDVGELVRCKDCAHYYYIIHQGNQFERGMCDALNDLSVRPDDYCSRADKRDTASVTAPTGFMSEWAREIEEQLNNLKIKNKGE